jgi:hypothetical protein
MAAGEDGIQTKVSIMAGRWALVLLSAYPFFFLFCQMKGRFSIQKENQRPVKQKKKLRLH